MDFLIEKNVPLPKRGKHRLKYPFDELEVGDSFLVPAVGENAAAAVIRSALAWGKRNGRQLTTRRDRNGGAVRVWRVT